MSIQEFYAAAQEKEFARNFQFSVRTLGPFTEKDLLYVTTANLPGKAITNQAVPYFGLQFNVPGTVTYPGSDAWAVTFRCDEGQNIRQKMDNYIKEIFDDETSTGRYGVPVEQATFDLLGKDLQPLRRFVFSGLYPTTIGEISYNVTDGGTVLEVPLTFAYQYYRVDTV
jgi:hypothetical protein